MPEARTPFPRHNQAGVTIFPKHCDASRADFAHGLQLP
jgi:hypothetical protein